MLAARPVPLGTLALRLARRLRGRLMRRESLALGWHERHPDEERVGERTEREREADRFNCWLAVEDEAAEHEDHDDRRSGHDSGARSEPGYYRVGRPTAGR